VKKPSRRPCGRTAGWGLYSGLRAWVLGAGLALLLGGTGCQTSTPQFTDFDMSPAEVGAAGATAAAPGQGRADARSEPLVLREGDVIKISFPGSPNMNTAQQIRRDGKISLQLVGEVYVVGMTTTELEKKLAELYDKQLLTKEVNVVLDSSAFTVYVTGAVSRQGKLTSDRPLTALEAVIDAGVDYSKANLKAVTVIRRHGDKIEYHKLNLKRVLQGQGETERFYLKPLDIIVVRERFTWF